jgi:hypothetical protein
MSNVTKYTITEVKLVIDYRKELFRYQTTFAIKITQDNMKKSVFLPNKIWLREKVFCDGGTKTTAYL